MTDYLKSAVVWRLLDRIASGGDPDEIASLPTLEVTERII